MAIIVEDGTNVVNANSYIDLAYLALYANVRGYDLPASDADKEQFLIRAMDYLESFNYAGDRANENQALSWPRKSFTLHRFDFPENSIPDLLKKAQAQLVVEQQMRVPLFPRPITSTTDGLVTEKTIGPIKKKFSEKGDNKTASPFTPIKIASVLIYLNPLLSCGQALKTIRV